MMETFFTEFKHASERFWSQAVINPRLYGFQVQVGTRWLSGLNKNEIASFETDMGFSFPTVYKAYLTTMNGTEPFAVNVYGESGVPYRYAPAYYSYPRDLELIQDAIYGIYQEFDVTPEIVEQRQIPHIMPITGHRFLVMDRCDTHPVLSMVGRDTIAYASSLQSFLVHDVFGHHSIESFDAPVAVPFWLNGESNVI